MMYPFCRTLGNGNKGEDVKILQQMLNALGYSAGSVDGIFGTGTQNALIAFQSSKSIPENGVLDAYTQVYLVPDVRNYTSLKYWTCRIQLPPYGSSGNPNGRLTKGQIDVVDLTQLGISYYKECLGKGTAGYDWTQGYADTPFGSWYGDVVSNIYKTSNPDSWGTGDYRLRFLDNTMEGYIGYAGDITATTRDGFYVHGGSPSTDPSAPNYPLRPTLGCIRVSNDNQAYILEFIKDLINNQNFKQIGLVHIYST